MSLFDTPGTITMLEKGMDAAVLRNRVVANNIANADTPGFKRSDVIFESELRRALESERAAKSDPVQLRVSDRRHIQIPLYREWRDVQPKIFTDYNSSMRNDGNNVDIEQEVANRNRTQLHYTFLADQVASKFRSLKSFARLA